MYSYDTYLDLDQRDGKEMEKVLMIEHFLPGNTYTYELVKELQKLTAVDMLCKSNAGVRSDIKKQSCLLYPDRTNKFIAPFVYAKSLLSLRNRVYSSYYDVIHVQTFKRASTEIPIYASSRRKATLVHTVHNVLPHEASEADVQLYKRFYDACDALITHNEHSKKLLIEEFAILEEKITVIPHGIYGSVKKLTKEAEDGKTHFLMFGMIREYKGVDILLKAIALIPKEIREQCVFTIAGRQYKNQHSVDYKKMASDLGISNAVEFILERIPDEDIPQLFGKADACLFPYKQIYGSGALLMAYTYLKPVIASDVPVFCEETENGAAGLLFRSEDPGSLANALVVFVEKKTDERRTYSRNIYSLVETKYNWKSSAQKTSQLYETIASENVR